MKTILKLGILFLNREISISRIACCFGNSLIIKGKCTGISIIPNRPSHFDITISSKEKSESRIFQPEIWDSERVLGPSNGPLGRQMVMLAEEEGATR
ncbi:MAG: hypothetical protein PHF35_03935 [Candidatus Moranbacteria bacterium]|nr:hypothetical protein [Candidatus Moranbacteria bacterium]